MSYQGKYGVSFDRTWYRKSVAISASANAQRQCLFEVNLSAAAGNVVITLPAVAPLPYYIGAVNRSALGNGSKVVIIQTSAAVEVCRLSAAGESVWVGKSLSGAWEILARANPSQWQWTWANATERLATLASTEQIGRQGYQTDLAQPFGLLDITGGAPNRWSLLNPNDVIAWREAFAQNNTTVMVQPGIGLTSITGTPLARACTQGNVLTQQSRWGITTAAGAGSLAQARNGVNIGPGIYTGLRMQLTIGLAAVSANMRWYAGVGPFAAATNVNPNTFTDALGIGRNAQGNLQFYNNDAAGLCTETDLGASFPAATVNTVYELWLYAALGAAAWTYNVRNVGSAAEISGVVNTNIMNSATSLMSSLFFLSNNTDAAVVGLDIMNYKIGQLTVR